MNNSGHDQTCLVIKGGRAMGVFRAGVTAHELGVGIAPLLTRIGMTRARWNHLTQGRFLPRADEVDAILTDFHRLGHMLLVLRRADVVAPDAPLRGGGSEE